jgi:CHASE2 domain-containing sensor protein
MQQSSSVSFCPFLTVGSLVAGRYRILRTLGSGGMASVYLAEDEVLGETRVALKILSQTRSLPESAAERFLREVRLTHKINHENVVRTFDFGQDGGMRFYTMEYLEGQTLGALCGQGMLPLTAILKIALQICRGLAAIHSVGVIHRDLKPDNIMVLDSLQVKITDFGVARGDGSMLTLGPEDIVGTIAYLAPETLVGGKTTQAVDYYSFAAILYELLTGHLPIEEESPALLILKKIETTPVDPREYRADTPDWLAEGLLELLVSEPVERMAAVQNFVQTLAAKAAVLVGPENISVPLVAEMPSIAPTRTTTLGMTFSFDDVYRNLCSPRHWLVTTVVALCIALASATQIAQRVEFAHLDNLFALRGVQAPSSDVLIVSIDESSYLNLNLPMGDLWPRKLHAKLLRKLNEYGVKRVVFDILFISPSEEPEADMEFAEALPLIPTVLGASVGLSKQATANGSFTLEQMIRPVPQFESKAQALGIVGLPQVNGRIRSFYVDRSDLFPDVPSLAEAASALEPGSTKPSSRDLINYYGPAATIKRFSYYDVISDEGRIPAEVFKDKIVFVGLNLQSRTGPSQREAFDSPFNSSIFGTEIHATATSNYLLKDWIKRPSELGQYTVSFGVALVCAVLIAAMSGLGSVVAFGCLLSAALAAQFGFFLAGTYMAIVTPLLLGCSAGFLIRTAMTHNKKRRLRRWG